MDQSDVMNELKSGIAVIEFKKVNGEYRKMQCTLSENYLPAQNDLEEVVQKKIPNPEVLAVFDIEAKGWRSFRWTNLETVNGVIFDGAQ